MKRLALLALAPLALAACSADKTALLRQSAIDQIAALEASGVNYVELSPERRARISAACAIATTVVTVWNPSVPDAPSTVENTCAVIMRASE